MSKARDLADLAKNANDRLDDVATSDGALSNRNLIINGAMQVAQRGTSVSTGNGYTLDRWYTNSQSSLSSTASQEEGSTFSFGDKHLKFISNASASYSYISQRVENMKQFSGKTFTLSFDYTSTEAFSSSLEYHYGTGGSSAEYDLQGVTVPAAASATRYTRVITFPDLSAKTYGPNNTSFLQILFNCTTNPTTLKITNVQLEVGDTATPFEHRSYGQELALCQRYYEVAAQGGHIGGFTYYTTTNAYGAWRFKVDKRSAPTVSASGATAVSVLSNANAYQSTAIAFANIESTSARVSIITPARTNGHGAWVNLNNGYFVADAEL